MHRGMLYVAYFDKSTQHYCVERFNAKDGKCLGKATQLRLSLASVSFHIF
jgi:hypothetical protein